MSSLVKPNLYTKDILSNILVYVPFSTLLDAAKWDHPAPEIAFLEQKYRIFDYMSMYMSRNSCLQFFEALEECRGVIIGEIPMRLVSDDPPTNGDLPTLEIAVRIGRNDPLSAFFERQGYNSVVDDPEPYYKDSVDLMERFTRPDNVCLVCTPPNAMCEVLKLAPERVDFCEQASCLGSHACSSYNGWHDRHLDDGCCGVLSEVDDEQGGSCCRWSGSAAHGGHGDTAPVVQENHHKPTLEEAMRRVLPANLAKDNGRQGCQTIPLVPSSVEGEPGAVRMGLPSWVPMEGG